ncbi:DUF4115 domain-containing protein [Paramagnetospirillum kuznetsovii]|uniref:DUF4115 domain-containing protein n=1 Tax=Paramagnetospirillum kuznetsovii TaxID=2053833 RepID=A0A364P1F1_9PROT|nr:helix-turn-helix domain-containing protein [Paramagnetospirillum kuznetsovii]RAU22945.1 DUF4115 domain-containing protein [Paramagnetospirillum kuznetsovii]
MEPPVSEQKSETPADPALDQPEQSVLEPDMAAISASEPDAAPVAEMVVAAPSPEPVAPAVIAPPAPTSGVGPTLRAARERMGKSLADCAKQLRIRQPFLEALEEGRHRDLPGGTYAAGFLRTYAEYLSLDGEEMVRRFRQEGAGGFATRAELSFPSPETEGRIPGGAVIFLGIILAAVAYGGWYMLSANNAKVAEIVPPLPDRLSTILTRQAALTGDAKTAGEAAKPAEEQVKAKEDVVPPQEAEEEKPVAPPAGVVAPPPVETAAAKPEPVKPEPAKVEPPKPEPVKVEPPKVETAKVEPAKPEPAKVEPPKPEPAKPEPAKPEPPKAEAPKAEPGVTTGADGKIYGSETADARVVLKATGDDCWIQVRELDGSLLMSRLLRRGDSYRVPNRPGLNLMVGNAGSLEVSIDGKKAPALGAVGQVRRDIRLDPDKLSSGG